MSHENNPLDESQVEDYAAEAFERAMAFGISRDDFTRLAKRVWREMRAHPAPSEPSEAMVDVALKVFYGTCPSNLFGVEDEKQVRGDMRAVLLAAMAEGAR